MAGSERVPHNRGHILWEADSGPSRMLLSSMDRWSTSILSDDGVDSPFFGPSQKNGKARIISRQDGIVVGTSMIDYMLQIWAGELRCSWLCSDGRKVNAGDEIGNISGPVEALLLFERSVLNILGFLSGIATEAKKWSAIAPHQIACTRKTTWGLLDKWAVHMGGGMTHRLSRKDALMIKENDLSNMSGSSRNENLNDFLKSVNYDDVGAFLEVEVQTPKEAIIAAFTWSERRIIENLPRLVIMLDNFSPDKCKSVIEELETANLRHHVFIEVSGGITYQTMEDWRLCGADVISTSAINRGTAPMDLSMIFD